jgi:hypothetical protein
MDRARSVERSLLGLTNVAEQLNPSEHVRDLMQKFFERTLRSKGDARPRTLNTPNPCLQPIFPPLFRCFKRAPASSTCGLVKTSWAAF